MVNWWLFVILALGIILTLGVATYVVILFTAEEDRCSAFFPRGIAVLAFAIASYVVLLLPFDVSASVDPVSASQLPSVIRADWMWLITIGVVTFFVLVVLPFATFYYEAYDPDQDTILHQICPALIQSALFFFIFAGLTFVGWLTIGFADIKYFSYQLSGTPLFADDPAIVLGEYDTADVRQVRTMDIPVSLFVYVVAMLSGLGWILFVFFGGAGLVALPFDLFKDWIRRPKVRLTAAELKAEQLLVADQATELLRAADAISKRQQERNSARPIEVARLKAQVIALEKQLGSIEECAAVNHFFYLKLVFKLALGCLCAVLSALWFVHTVVYTLLGLHPLLNSALVALDSAFQLLGLGFYALLTFYLLWCAFVGCIKVGLRVPCFQVQTMRRGKTLANALLFNAALLLMTSVTVTQFAAQSFAEYAANTAVQTLLSAYVLRLRYVGYVLVYFPAALLVVALLSTIWVVLCPVAAVRTEEEDGE